MTEPQPSELVVSPKSRSPWRNLSFVWLIPILALVVSLALAWQTYSQRGVLIEIAFLNAAGVTAKDTTVRYRDVIVGEVEDVAFSPDLSKVIVSARIDKDVAPFLDKDTQFWVVRPQVSARGISGLSTVLSGVYIEGAWDLQQGEPQESFVGSEDPPLVQPGREGTRITLMTNDGRLISNGAPVYFRGIEVGRLEKPRLTLSDDTIVVDAFIAAPHDRRLSTATRFWDTSGFSVSFGGSGLTLDFDSIATLVAGGVAFDSIFEGGDPVKPGHVFNIFSEEAAARKSLFVRSIDNAVDIAAEFDESVNGLQSGAAVRFGGLDIGTVKSIEAKAADGIDGPTIRLLATLSIDATSLGLPADASADQVYDFFDESVAGGLRARLATANLFNSALVVELVDLPDAEPATFQRDAEPAPIIPSVPSNLPDFTATAEGMIERINSLPIEELIQQAIGLMASIENLAKSDGIKSVPDEVAGLLKDARTLVNDDATRALPGEIRNAVAELRSVVSDLRTSGTVEKLSDALEQANAAIANIATASQDFPALMSDLREVAAKAKSLEAEELMAAATRVLDSADQVLGTQAARDLPPALNQALEQIRATMSDLRQGGMVENANSAMASARDAADALARAAEGLPALSSRLDSLVAQTERLIAAYGDRSSFNDETLATLREMRTAARSVSQLARAIERNPNSLLMGR